MGETHDGGEPSPISTTMPVLFRIFFDICLLRAGPQSLPYSAFLFGVCMGLYAFSGLLLLVRDVSFAAALGQVVVDAGVLLGLAYMVLRGRGLASRFVQTATAMVGSGALLGLLVLPIALTMPAPMEGANPPGLTVLALLGVMAWSVIVPGHIFRESMDAASLAPGVALALVYVVVSLSLTGLLFPSAV